MVLIAIDKHSRKILGYLCRNNQDVAYCCSDCDIEFTSAHDLEKHMVIHENLQTFTQRTSKRSDLDDVPLNVLSDIEREKQLKMKYQVQPCTVQLFRFDNDDSMNMIEMDVGSSMPPAFDNTNQENMSPFNEQQTKRRPGPASRVKKHNKIGKKLLKKQSPPPAVCYLCGLKFQSTIAMEQHQKTHIQSSTNSPVFPCKVCGKNVKNLKIHLRQHKNENKNKSKKAAPKVVEASSSTDAVVTNVSNDPKELGNARTQSVSLQISESEPSQSTQQTPISQLIMPPIVVEEFSLRKILTTNPISESEPSQSTQQTVASVIVDAQGISLQNSEMVAEKIVESPLNTDKKVQCDFCSKRIGLSYRRIHVKKYHTNTQTTH